MGNPMSHATHGGFSGPPAGGRVECATALASVIPRFAPDGRRPPSTLVTLAPLPSLFVGVGQVRCPSACRKSLRASTASDVIVLRSPPGIRRFIAMCAAGVLPSSFATGVGNDPDAVPPVRGAKGACRKAVPLRVIPERGQVPENNPESSRKESCDVLHNDVAGSKFANDSGVLRPKTRPGAGEPCTLPGEGEILAGEPAADDIDGGEVVGADVAHVGVPFGVGEVVGEDGSAEGVELDLPCGSHPGPLEPEVEAADAREEGADTQHRSWSMVSRIAATWSADLTMWASAPARAARPSS